MTIKREIRRLLEQNGCELKREGTKHLVFARPDGSIFTLSRRPGDNLPALERIIRNGAPALTVKGN